MPVSINISFLDDMDATENEFARLLNEETEAEESRDSRLKRSSRGAEGDDIEDDYIPTNIVKEATVDKVSSGLKVNEL